MTDLNERYLKGVGDLLRVMEPTDIDYLTVLTLQGRLAQAIAEIRQYGPTDSARAEIARVTTELDKLSLAHLDQSFRALCGIDELSGAAPPMIYHNLPQPDYGHFVGREQEMTKIYELLSPANRHFLVTIDGIGGIGKSALALEVAHRYLQEAASLPASERFDAIIWTSAKQTMLTAEGIIKRKHALHTLDDIYTTISVTLEREDITRARLDEQHEIVRKILTQQRVLLIVDNLETVDDETVLEFLRELPAPTKAIVTTRHRLDVAYPIRLAGMPWGEAKSLIVQECNKRGVTLIDNQAHKLYERTGGVPLALVWSIAQIGFGYSTETVLSRLGDPKGDIARFCFEGVVEHIRGTDAHKLLMALTLFATDADRDALGYVAGLGEDDLSRDEGLVVLEKLSLVNKRGERFALLPLTRSYSLYEVEYSTDFTQRATKRWMAQLTGLLKSKADWYWIEDQAVIMREGENFRGLLEWATSHGDYETALQVMRPSVMYLQYSGRRVEALKLALDGKEVAGQAVKKDLGAWLCIDAGWILSQQGAHEEAIEQIEEGIKEYKQLANDTGLCFAKCFMAQTLRLAGKLREAEKSLEEVISESAQLEYREGTILGKFECGKLAREQNDWNKAYVHFLAAHTTLLELKNAYNEMFSLTILAIQGNYGTAALKLGKYSEAKDITLEVLSTLEKWRSLGLASNFTSRMHLQVAEIEEALENYPEAISQASQALVLYTSTKYEKGIKQAQQMLERLRA
jgi:tetratricopeptide (TPR) repeat protein